MAIPSQAISQMTTLVGSNRNDNCLFTLYNALISSSVNQNLKARISTHEQFYSNNNTVINQGTYNNYFGTGKDGSVTISSSAQISSSTSPAGLNNISREFGDPVIKNFQNLTIDSGVLFSPLRACRGMIIYCTGNLTVNGTLSMTGKGGGVGSKVASPIGFATSTDSRYDLVDATLYFNNFSSSTAGGRGIPTHWNWAPSGSIWFNNYKIRVPLSGSAAGGGPNNGGSAGIFCCGGGGGGGQSNPGAVRAGGSGGSGTIFLGGGGGGGGSYGGGAGTNGIFEAGGIGGFGPNPGLGPNGSGGGGAGTPAGPGSGGAGNTGVGGLIILIVRGNITINGTVSSGGANGGNGTTGGAGAAGGGGGSGGGRIIIIYGGTYSNVGTIVVNGGSGGAGGPGALTGGAGGAGSITIRRVNV